MTSSRAHVDLVKRVVIGDQAAAAELVERHHRPARQVKAMASRKGGRLLYG
jgi:hypothetical protein